MKKLVVYIALFVLLLSVGVANAAWIVENSIDNMTDEVSAEMRTGIIDFMSIKNKSEVYVGSAKLPFNFQGVEAPMGDYTPEDRMASKILEKMLESTAMYEVMVRIDKNKPFTFPAAYIKSECRFILDPAAVTPGFFNQLKKGNNVSIRIPSDRNPGYYDMKFSLRGFTKAFNQMNAFLNSPEAKKAAERLAEKARQAELEKARQAELEKAKERAAAEQYKKDEMEYAQALKAENIARIQENCEDNNQRVKSGQWLRPKRDCDPDSPTFDEDLKEKEGFKNPFDSLATRMRKLNKAIFKD